MEIIPPDIRHAMIAEAIARCSFAHRHAQEVAEEIYNCVEGEKCGRAAEALRCHLQKRTPDGLPSLVDAGRSYREQLEAAQYEAANQPLLEIAEHRLQQELASIEREISLLREQCGSTPGLSALLDECSHAAHDVVNAGKEFAHACTGGLFHSEKKPLFS